MQPGKEVEVETSDTHDRVVCVFLIRNGKGGDGIPNVGKVVVARVDGFEESG